MLILNQVVEWKVWPKSGSRYFDIDRTLRVIARVEGRSYTVRLFKADDGDVPTGQLYGSVSQNELEPLLTQLVGPRTSSSG